MARMNKLESIVKGMVEVKFIFIFLNVSWSLPLFINFLSGASPSLSFVIACLSVANFKKLNAGIKWPNI